jgi:hypothetical protein
MTHRHQQEVGGSLGAELAEQIIIVVIWTELLLLLL